VELTTLTQRGVSEHEPPPAHTPEPVTPAEPPERVAPAEEPERLTPEPQEPPD
jgi:hypothetical protein